MSYPSEEFIYAFDRGSRLQQRLSFGYYWTYLEDGLVVRHVNEYSDIPEDVIEKKWAEIKHTTAFQAFLDEVSRLISPVEEEANEAECPS